MRARRLADHGGESTFVIVFADGDEVIEGLTTFAKQHDISAARFTALGAFSEVTLGFYDLQRKEYRRLPVREQVEALSLVGNVALADGQPKVHAHAVVGHADGRTNGGHLLDARVRPTLEVVLVESPRHLQRVHDPATGLPLLALDPDQS